MKNYKLLLIAKIKEAKKVKVFITINGDFGEYFTMQKSEAIDFIKNLNEESAEKFFNNIMENHGYIFLN